LLFLDKDRAGALGNNSVLGSLLKVTLLVPSLPPSFLKFVHLVGCVSPRSSPQGHAHWKSGTSQEPTDNGSRSSPSSSMLLARLLHHVLLWMNGITNDMLALGIPGDAVILAFYHGRERSCLAFRLLGFHKSTFLRSNDVLQVVTRRGSLLGHLRRDRTRSLSHCWCTVVHPNQIIRRSSGRRSAIACSAVA